MLENLVGSSNVGEVMIQGERFEALIDTGAMVTTIQESAYNDLYDKPQLKSLDNLGPNLSVADGSALRYLGYIECDICVPSLSEFETRIPMLVLPDNTSGYSVIVGTNVLRLYKSCTEDQMPTAWQLAIDSMDVMATVKSTNRKPVHVYPNQSIVLNGIARNVDELTEVITENCDSELNYLVCPRVLKFGRSAKVQKVPVKICNITAKTITIRPKSDICSISPVKVVDSLASETVDSGVPRKESIPVDLGVNIDKDNLSANQVENVHELLSSWKRVFIGSIRHRKDRSGYSHY